MGPGPQVDNGPRGPREWQQIPMDLWEKMGLDLLIPVHSPLAAQCHHSPPLPCGCQGNWANTTPAGSSKPSPNPTKPPDACRKGKAGYPLPGKEEVREAEPSRLVLFHFFLQRQPSLSPTLIQGGHGELGRLSGGKEAHANPGLETERPYHSDGSQSPLPLQTGPGLYHHPLSGVERELGGG